jgi:membrane-bound lytic murein transglycosylase D
MLPLKRNIAAGLVYILIMSGSSVAFGADSKPPRFDARVLAEVRESLKAQSLSEDAALFSMQQTKIVNADDCLPLFVRQMAELRVLYLHCSSEALAEDSKPRKVSESFTVPAELARRFNFWRRIYGLWAKDQYVLHSSEFPEVILEIMDASKIYKSDFLGREAQAESYVSQVGRLRRAKYRELLLQLHSKRKVEISQLRPELQRIARLFDHIKDPSKYGKAAHSLRFQRGQRDFIAQGLTVGPKYLHAIEPAFTAQGVPKELSKLAYIESSFNLSALSKVGASGVYQIMPETGKQYLKMTTGIDERNDPVKAAHAAAKLLRMNYEILGSWPLAVTAYNHGVGGLKRAVRATGTTDLGYMVHNYSNPQFQFASKNFFCGFLAILATLEEREKLFPDISPVEPLKFQTVKINRSITVKEAAKRHHMTLDELLALNRDIQRNHARSGGMLPRGYVLKVWETRPAEVASTADDQPIRKVGAGLSP